MTEYLIRPTTRADVQAVVDLVNARSIALVGAPEDTVASVLADWDTPGLNLETDCVVAETPGGRLIGTAELWDIQPQHVRMFGFLRVAPDFAGSDVWDALADCIEKRAARSLSRSDPEARVVLLHRFIEQDRCGIDLMERRGYQLVRVLVRMVVDFSANSQTELPLDGGLRLEPWTPKHEDGAFYALYEAFQDHWGAVPETFEEYRMRMGHIFEHPEVRPELSLVALDGEEVVGTLIASEHPADDEQMGWINLLGVRRPWRKRGVGQALLLRVFGLFRKQGSRSAGLNVDSQSLTGATRLYEKVGMRVTRRYLTYELVLREGEERTLR